MTKFVTRYRFKYSSSGPAYYVPAMTMAIFRENGLESIDLLQSAPSDGEAFGTSPSIPLVGAKLEVPSDHGSFEREWLQGLLQKYSTVGAATMIIGRAGTGKTSLVADFARRTQRVSWYSIDPADSDWSAFQRYFSAAWTGSRSSAGEGGSVGITPAQFVSDLQSIEPPSIIVLDNLHHLYDCSWFPELFSVLMRSIPDRCHLILLSRSKPPAPVWRLRSKQVLNIIDERLLAFSQAEAAALFKSHRLTSEAAAIAHRQSFGRAAELLGHLARAAGS